MKTITVEKKVTTTEKVVVGYEFEGWLKGLSHRGFNCQGYNPEIRITVDGCETTFLMDEGPGLGAWRELMDMQSKKKFIITIREAE